MKKSSALSLLMLLGAAIIWGFAFAAQDAASDVPAFALGGLRSLVGGVFLIFVVILFDKIKKSPRRLFSPPGGERPIIDVNRLELVGGIICGVILALASAFQQLGINQGTDGGKAAFITALYSVLVPIYALPLKKRAPLNVWISVAVAAVGFYLLCIKDGFRLEGSDVSVIISSMIFPIHILTIDRFAPKCDGVRMSMIQFFSCAAVNALLSLIIESPVDPAPVISAVLPVLYLGIASSGIAYTLQILGQNGVNPAAASIILSLESVFGVLGTALFLGQTLSPREYLGCAIVLLAVILSQLAFPKRKRKMYDDEREGGAASE